MVRKSSSLRLCSYAEGAELCAADERCSCVHMCLLDEERDATLTASRLHVLWTLRCLTVSARVDSQRSSCSAYSRCAAAFEWCGGRCVGRRCSGIFPDSCRNRLEHARETPCEYSSISRRPAIQGWRRHRQSARSANTFAIHPAMRHVHHWSTVSRAPASCLTYSRYKVQQQTVRSRPPRPEVKLTGP